MITRIIGVAVLSSLLLVSGLTRAAPIVFTFEAEIIASTASPGLLSDTISGQFVIDPRKFTNVDALPFIAIGSGGSDHSPSINPIGEFFNIGGVRTTILNNHGAERFIEKNPTFLSYQSYASVQWDDGDFFYFLLLSTSGRSPSMFPDAAIDDLSLSQQIIFNTPETENTGYLIRNQYSTNTAESASFLITSASVQIGTVSTPNSLLLLALGALVLFGPLRRHGRPMRRLPILR
jgi:hypothetical protein